MKSKTQKKGGDCGCGSGNQVISGQSGGCVSCSKTEGGGFSIPPTSQQPEIHNYYSLNSYSHDPMMQTNSVRIEGVPVSSSFNVNGGNDVKITGGKRKKRKNKKTKTKLKTKKRKIRRTKKTKIQKGGINLGYVAQNSLMGHGQYGSWFGAPTNNTPDWNASIFTSPVSQNTTGYTQYNKYLV